MKAQAQQIAIAKACGWGSFRSVPDELQPQIMRLEGISLVVNYGGGGFNEVPDYPHDLNAMHEAENALTLEEHSYYRENLAMVVGFTDISPNGGRAYVSATAAQRAEAFLKTLGLWEE